MAVADIDILDPAEREKVLVDWNNTAAPVPDTTLAGMSCAVVPRSTAWRYVREAVDLLAATAYDLAAMVRIRASAALPGSIHDLTAARTHGVLDALTSANVMTFADKAYQGARGGVRTPFKRHPPRRATAIVQAILVLHHVENPMVKDQVSPRGSGRVLLLSSCRSVGCRRSSWRGGGSRRLRGCRVGECRR